MVRPKRPVPHSVGGRQSPRRVIAASKFERGQTLAIARWIALHTLDDSVSSHRECVGGSRRIRIRARHPRHRRGLLLTSDRRTSAVHGHRATPRFHERGPLGRGRAPPRPPRPPAAPAAIAQRGPAKEKIAAEFGAEQVAQAKPTNDGDELHTTIEGTVQEFSGRAVFVLGNGQIWQLRTPTDVFLPKKLVNPTVTLIRGAFGYKLVIDAADLVLLVKRVQ